MTVGGYDYHVAQDTNHIWLTDDDGGPVGMAYVAPQRMTEGTWNLYLIAIHPERQREGPGRLLLEHVEKLLAERGERVLIVETSGTEDFDYVRSFYLSARYDEEARIREFYAAGVDKVVYRVTPLTDALAARVRARARLHVSRPF